jgi:hypothetical protein
MRRMAALIQLIKETYPRDKFFDSVGETLRLSKQARASYRAYDKAFECLDQASWERLSKKAVAHFRDHRRGQLKQGFFNQLNEAFAYQFLLRQGYTHVSVLPEDGKTTPDLSYRQGNAVRYCEVKSIGISEEQIDRWEAEEGFDGSIYYDLSAGFLRKLDADLTMAYKQITSKGPDGIVFIVASFDDFTLSHYERYRVQIAQHLSQTEVPEVYVKVGLLGGRKIHKRTQNHGTSSKTY